MSCPVSRPTCLGHAEHRTCPSCSSSSGPRGESQTMNKAKLKTGDEITKQSDLLCASGLQRSSRQCLSKFHLPSPNSPQAAAAPSPFPAWPILIPRSSTALNSPHDTHIPRHANLLNSANLSTFVLRFSIYLYLICTVGFTPVP